MPRRLISNVVTTCFAVSLSLAGSSTADYGKAATKEERSPLSAPPRLAADELEAGKLRLREGTHLTDAPGRFRTNGDSITFVDSQDREIGGLPNLNLERVARMLKSVEEPEGIAWSVSGEITEFGGRNFILISRAVYKSSAAPPKPERIELPGAEPPAEDLP